MVDRLRGFGLLSDSAVEAALRLVPRHVFVPLASLDEAYSGQAIVTRRDDAGVAVSSASAPGVVAGMLEQLGVRPGDRVLEIGAGTGYNAALLACLAGPSGQVTTVEIDEGIAAQAGQALADAGFGDVVVACGDGEDGAPGGGVFDRIIVTAGAWDIPPSWQEQLAPGGRLVVPLRIRGATRSVALERAGECWRSLSVDELGFMPLRGAGAMAERNLRAGDVVLRLDDGQDADAEALGRAMGGDPAVAWTGVRLPAGEVGHLDFWLAGLDGFCRMLVASPDAVGTRLVAPVYDWGSMAVHQDGCLAYLTLRRPPGSAGGPGRPGELGVCAYGPDGEALAGKVAGRVREWDRARQSMTRLWIEVHPAGGPAGPGDVISAAKRHSLVRVRAE